MLGYRASGGFSYWGGDKPDIAITAYALQFLVEAHGVIDVESSAIDTARDYLVHQSNAGTWKNVAAVDAAPDLPLTSLVLRSLAAAPKSETAIEQQKLSSVLSEATAHLEKNDGRIEDPYTLASFLLAVPEKKVSEQLAVRLRSLAHVEGDGAFWDLQSNTPFYGWGRAGRIETTAIVVQALASVSEHPADDKDVERGLLFLLRGKDQYGVWYSTQATINVVRALMQVIAKSPETGDHATLRVNGHELPQIQFLSSKSSPAPVEVDIREWLTTGSNSVEVTSPSHIAMQVVADYYRPWQPVDAKPAANENLRFTVSYDKLNATVAEVIACRVHAERVGFRGYGMLLAEVGLPPGADVDRDSLDRAKSDWRSGVEHYDVLPDRVIFYLWPRAGGADFSFNFHPRVGERAKSAPSQIYDYYNPDAHVVVAPQLFTVK